MTSRSETGRDGGFTLIEIIVVLVILGLALTVVATHGPPRSRGVDLRVTAAEIAATLRQARAQAIATNRTLRVVVDAEHHRIDTPNGTMRGIPAEFGIALRGLGARVDNPRIAIAFAPDGSSSGGTIELSSAAMRLRIVAAWLTGRVSVTNVP